MMGMVVVIAPQGFAELEAEDPSFAAFRESLFSAASLQFDREQEAGDANEKLDAAIAAFLDLLQGYLLLPAALTALEYLVRRYPVRDTPSSASPVSLVGNRAATRPLPVLSLTPSYPGALRMRYPLAVPSALTHGVLWHPLAVIPAHTRPSGVPGSLIVLYRIHEYNVPQVVACVLPYHETNTFVRIVQLLALK